MSGTIAPEDPGWFNYTGYESSTLRLFRADLAAEARLAPFASVLFDVRSDNLEAPRVYALYLRLTPWKGREVDLQAGLVPPVFGAFPRRRYAFENPLPGTPLAYQYLTNLREDSVPSRSEELVAQRGRGWRVRYPVGSTEAGPGVPLVERRAVGRRRAAAARPRAALARGGRHAGDAQLPAGARRQRRQAGLRPPRPGRRPLLRGRCLGVLRGVPRARGAGRAPGERRATRTGSRPRASTCSGPTATGSCAPRPCGAAFTLPALDPTRIEDPLPALGLFAEARYKLLPGLYLARPASTISPPRGSRATWALQTWDAPVTRVEAGAGWAPLRHVLLKASWQHNWRDGGTVRESDLVAGQVDLWF